jgi:hypothetical protein
MKIRKELKQGKLVFSIYSPFIKNFPSPASLLGAKFTLMSFLKREANAFKATLVSNCYY